MKSLGVGNDVNPAAAGLTQFNFHWGEVGDISGDIPMQLNAEAERDKLRADPAMRAKLAKIFGDGDGGK
jgi:hypothetical protein